MNRCLLTAAALIAGVSAFAQSRTSIATDTTIKGGRQVNGVVLLGADGKSVNKRFVIRVPEKWNGSLVIGAHGGSGGDAINRAGKVYATSETALDDVIGEYAFTSGFAYASFDRDGVGGTRAGYGLTMDFESAMHDESLASAEPRRSGLTSSGSRPAAALPA